MGLDNFTKLLAEAEISLWLFHGNGLGAFLLATIAIVYLRSPKAKIKDINMIWKTFLNHRSK